MIECPGCNEIVILVKDNATIVYKKIIINYEGLSYTCQSCGLSYTTTELDTINIDNIKKSYLDYKINKIIN